MAPPTPCRAGPAPRRRGGVRAATLPSWCLPIPAPQPPGRPYVGRHLMAPPTPCRAGPAPRRRGGVRAATLPSWCLPIPAPRPRKVVQAARSPSRCLPIPSPQPPGRPCVGRHLMAPPTPCRAGPAPRRRGGVRAARLPAWCLPIPAPRPPGRPGVAPWERSRWQGGRETTVAAFRFDRTALKIVTFFLAMCMRMLRYLKECPASVRS